MSRKKPRATRNNKRAQQSIPPELQDVFRSFKREVDRANDAANEQAKLKQRQPQEFLDYGQAIKILNTNPRLTSYLEGIMQRHQAEAQALGTDGGIPFAASYAVPGMENSFFAQKRSGPPTGSHPQSNSAATGWWSTGGTSSAVPQGVNNAQQLRYFADNNEWVRAAINIRRQQVGRADIAVLPHNERKTWNRQVMKKLQRLLDQPNMYRDSYRSLIEPIIEDVLVLDRGCLDGREPIVLADGTTRPIGDIVRQRAEVEVLALNEETGALEPKRITGWYRNRLGNRQWVKVSHAHARNLGRHGRVACWFTDDHQLLTEHGWKQIKHIAPSERVVTRFSAPNASQAQLFDGMLLGDSSLESRSGSSRAALRTTHCAKQRGWLEAKYAALPCFEKSNVSATARGQLRQSAWSHPWLEEQRERWYPNGRKIVPANLELSALTVAAWYMDDGSLGVRRYIANDGENREYHVAMFATCGFTYEDQLRLAQLLTAWGVETHVQRQGEYCSLYVGAKAARILFDRIAPYVVPDMRYKLPPQASAYDATLWDLGDPVPYLDTITVIPGNPAGGRNPVPQTTYCIDVADHHNFIASGLVAHNCISKNMTPGGRRGGGRVATELYYEDGATIKVYTDWDGNPKKPRYLYEEVGTNTKVPLRNDELICISMNPATYRLGLSPVQFLRQTIQAEMRAIQSATHIVDMKPAPHIVQIPGAHQTQITNLKNNYDSEVAGRKELFWMGGENEAKVFSLTFSARDNQWLEWQQWLARKIATAFQISPQQFGFTADINRSNGEIQQQLYEDTGLIPLLLLLEEYLNRELLMDFCPLLDDGRADLEALNLRIVYPEVSEAERALHAERAADIAQKTMGGLPTATVNQILMMRGEEPVPGGNTFWIKTSTGAVPWLTYDHDYGDWSPLASLGGFMGAQDVLSGPDEESEDDGATGGDNENPEQVGAPAGGSASSGAGAKKPDSSGVKGGDESSASGLSGTPSFNAAAPLKPAEPHLWKKKQDLRRPGHRWNPAARDFDEE